MSNMFSKPDSPDIPEPEKVEDVKKVKDDASEEQRRQRKKIVSSEGRAATLQAGIDKALSKRLGE